MLERECLLNAFVMDYTRKLVDGIDEEAMDVQPAPGMNTPRWILGHLATSADFAAKHLGVATLCPKEWYAAFGPGSRPGAASPAKAELLGVIEALHERVTAAARAATGEVLAGPHSFAPARAAFPTVADFLAHLLTTHPMLHLGQLSAWRRLRGLPAVLGF